MHNVLMWTAIFLSDNSLLSNGLFTIDLLVLSMMAIIYITKPEEVRQHPICDLVIKLLTVLHIVFWLVRFFPVGLFLIVYQLPILISPIADYWRQHILGFSATIIVWIIIVATVSNGIIGYWINAHIGDNFTIWYPRKRLEQLALEIKKQEKIPNDQNELYKLVAEARELENYGWLCYFPQSENNDYYLVGRYAGLWFVFTRDGELDRSYHVDSAAARGQFVRCAQEKEQ